jgi:hypothetical protein
VRAALTVRSPLCLALDHAHWNIPKLVIHPVIVADLIEFRSGSDNIMDIIEEISEKQNEFNISR